jgi:uncharacterized protein YoaH (UPF0181 family)
MNHHLLPVSKIQQLLSTGQQGLNVAQVDERLRQYSKDALTEKKKNQFCF